MNFAPTTTVTVYGGTSTDAYGDPTDGTTVKASGVPASVLEQTRRVTRYGDSRPQTVRYTIGRVPSGTAVEAGDRVLDAAGTWWMVDSAHQMQSPVHTSDIVLDLRRA